MEQKSYSIFVIAILGVILISGCTQNNSKQIQDLQNQISELENTINQQNSVIQDLSNQIQTLRSEQINDSELESCVKEFSTIYDYIPSYFTGEVLVQFDAPMYLEDAFQLLRPIGLTESQEEDIRQDLRNIGFEEGTISTLSVPVPVGKEIIKVCELRKIDKIEIAELNFVVSGTGTS